MTMNYRNFIYNEERGFIFAYVPKVACTNWKSIMRYLAGHKDYLDNRLAHDKAAGGLRYLDLTGPDLALLSDRGIRKYSFVRNPYSRILSAYLNKIEDNLPLGSPNSAESHWAKVAGKVDEFRLATLDNSQFPEVTFEVFLLWLRDGKNYLREDEHWQQQSVLLRWPQVKFDFIGRFEYLQEDSKYILAQMGCDVPFPSQKDVSFTPTDADRKLSNVLSDNTRQMITALFNADFKAFDYDTKSNVFADQSYHGNRR